jgi:hypothetical protein
MILASKLAKRNFDLNPRYIVIDEFDLLFGYPQSHSHSHSASLKQEMISIYFITCPDTLNDCERSDPNLFAPLKNLLVEYLGQRKSSFREFNRERSFIITGASVLKKIEKRPSLEVL